MNNRYQKPAFHPAGIVTFCFLFFFIFASFQPARAQTDEEAGSRWQRFKQIREPQRANNETVVSEESLGAITANIHDDTFFGRDMLVYVPRSLPAARQREF